LIKRNIKERLKDGYRVLPVFVTNQDKDTNTDEYLKINKALRIFDRSLIASSFVDVDAARQKAQSFAALWGGGKATAKKG
jgi:hypothetical protein